MFAKLRAVDETRKMRPGIGNGIKAASLTDTNKYGIDGIR